MIAVVLGIWKTGGAFLPLDPDYPPERIACSCATRACRSSSRKRPSYPKSTSAIPVLGTDPSGLPEVVCIDASQTRSQDESTRNLEATPAADALAYMIYHLGLYGQAQRCR